MDHEAATPEQRKAAYRFAHELTHLVSLLFALIVKHLRKDFDLSTLYPHDMAGKAPFVDSNVGVRGWSRWEVFVTRMLALNDLFEIHNPQQQAEVPVIGGLREEERLRLMDLVPTPAMKGRGATLNGARPYAVFALINQLYIRRIKEGGLQTHAPLVARLGGIAEEGMAAFGHCSKLAATQFPFAWAQVVMAFLAIMGLLLPFVVANFVEQLWMGVVLSFVVVLTYWSLNEVASEMEDPFGFDPNDLPLARYAFDFNNGILASVYQLRPPYFDQIDAEEAQQRQQQPQGQQATSNNRSGRQRLAFVEQMGCSGGGGDSSGGGTGSEDFSRMVSGSDVDAVCGGGGGEGDGAGRSAGGGGGGDMNSSVGGGGGGNSSFTRLPDGPLTPLYTPAPTPPRTRPITSQSSQPLSPTRWVAGCEAPAEVAAAPPPPPATAQRATSNAAPLRRPGSSHASSPDMQLLESARSVAAVPGSGGGGSAPVAEAAGGGGAAAASTVIFSTPFSRQPSSRCDSLRVSMKSSAVLPLNS